MIIQGNSPGSFVALHIAWQRPERTPALILSGCGYLQPREMMVRRKKHDQEEDLALREARGPVVVAGSLYLVGTARGILVDDPTLRDP